MKIQPTALDLADGDAKINIVDGGIDIEINLGWLVPIDDMGRLNRMSNDLDRYFSRNGCELDQPFRIEAETVNGTDCLFLRASYAITQKVVHTVKEDETLTPEQDDGGY